MASIAEMCFYIPETYVDYRHVARLSGLPESVVVEKLGLRRKPVEKELGVVEMAHRSASPLLRSREEKEGVKVVVYAGSDAKGRGVWTAAPKLGHMLGLPHYFGFDVSAQCVGGLVGLYVGSKLVSPTRRVLLSVPTRQSQLVDYGDRASTFMYDFSDGAVSMVISWDEGKYELLGSSFLSDGWFSDVVYSESRAPDRLVVHEVEGWRERMEASSLSNFLYVVEQALADSGLGKTKIDFLGLVHMKRSFHSSLLRALGLGGNQSVYLEEYGHMQGVDPFLSLRLGEQKGLVRAGNTVVLVSAGTGWTWGACVLRVNRVG